MSNNNHWGAVTYLSTSIYGIDTTSSKKVYNNGYYNSSNTSSNQVCTVDTTTNPTTPAVSGCRYITGAGPVASQSDNSGTAINPYHTTIGQQASTTGNIYGIYDMAGGTWEYQMAVLTCANDSQLSTGYTTTYNSGFSNGTGTTNNCYNGFQSAIQPTSNPTPWPDTKYLNIYPRYATFTNNSYYTNNNQCTYQTCGGQALHETKTVQSVSSDTQSWGSDYSNFVNSTNPWFERGGNSNNGSNAGVFASNRNNGNANNNISFRVLQCTSTT
jgi:hypothetical protein